MHDPGELLLKTRQDTIREVGLAIRDMFGYLVVLLEAFEQRQLHQERHFVLQYGNLRGFPLQDLANFLATRTRWQRQLARSEVTRHGSATRVLGIGNSGHRATGIGVLSWSQALRLLEPTSTVQSSRRERPQSSLSRQSGKFLGILCLVQQKGRKCADLQANVVFLMHRLAREVHLRAER